MCARSVCSIRPSWVFYSVQDYKLLARDLSTTLLFLVVFLKSHSEELRGAGRREEGGSDWRKSVLVREDVSRDVNALFVAMADVFHCWFSSPVSFFPPTAVIESLVATTAYVTPK